MKAATKTSRTELLDLFAEIVDPRTVCEACGLVGEFEQVADRRACSGCHAGCGVAKCRDAYGEGRSPVEARLWRLAAHARVSRDPADVLAFRAALANYEAAGAA